jgi:hypothetical protein
VPEFLVVLGLALLPAVANFAGGVAAEIVDVSGRTLSLSLYLAAGIVLAVIGLELMPEALQAAPPWVPLLAFGAGGAVFIRARSSSSPRHSRPGLGRSWSVGRCRNRSRAAGAAARNDDDRPAVCGLEDNALGLDTPKTDAGIRTCISRRACSRELREHLAAFPDPDGERRPVFTNGEGRPLNRGGFRAVAPGIGFDHTGTTAGALSHLSISNPGDGDRYR